jgi:hypothetical protein
MKNLIKYTHGDLKVKLEDYFGEKHSGKIIVEKVEMSKGRGYYDNHYFFIRDDGAKVRVYHKGIARISETSPNNLRLSLRNSYGNPLTPKEFIEFTTPNEPKRLDSLKFNNMRVK